MKNKKIVYSVTVILLIALATTLFYAFRPANKQITKKPASASFPRKRESREAKAKKPEKPPVVKTYKQEVIVKASFAKEKPGRKYEYPDEKYFIYPKKPEDYGILTAMELGGPTAIAVDKQENVYVLDSIGSNIKKYDSNGKFIKAIPSPFEWPTDLAIDDERNIYVQSDNQYSVVKIDQDGKALLEYSLSEQISPRGATSLYFIEIIDGILYGVTSFTKDWNSDIFDLGIEGLREGESASFKIGTTKKPFNSEQQLRSINAGILGKDGNIYDWRRDKKNRIIVFSTTDKTITKTTFDDNFKSAGIGSQENIYDKKGNIYDSYTINYKNSYAFLIQKYSKGYLATEAILPYGSDYQWTKLVAVSGEGTVYYLYSDLLSKDYSGGVKIIKCTPE